MNYQCHYCKSEFPALEAIDGFSEGYKTGFLCPECGKNIQDKPFNNDWKPSSKSASIFYGIAVGYAGLAWIILESIKPNTWQHYLVALSGFAVVFVYGHIKHPKDMYSPTMGTQPVKESEP